MSGTDAVRVRRGILGAGEIRDISEINERSAQHSDRGGRAPALQRDGQPRKHGDGWLFSACVGV